jgi:peptide/nickel transport system substrate-binding protein
LRQGVAFHDGQEFTAEAVKFTMEHAIRPPAKSMLNLGKDSVRVVDKFTVDITPVKSNKRIVELLTHASYGIKAPGSDWGKHPMGTGPFQYASYQKNKQLVVNRNPNYWGAKAKIDQMIFKFIPDPVTRILALQSGEVDVVTHVPEEMISQVKKTKGLQVLFSPYAAAHSQIRIRVNGSDSNYIVADRSVRHAIAHALDRQSIIKTAWEGIGQVSRYELPPEILGEYASQMTELAYNPELAASILEKAGWHRGTDGIRAKDGRPLVLTLISGYHDWGGRVAESVPQMIQNQLKAVGIGIDIVYMKDPGLKNAKLTEGYGHAWLGQADQNNADPTMWPSFVCHGSRYYGLTYNKVWSPGKRFDEAIEAAIATPDPLEATRLTAQALDILVGQEAVMIPLALTYTIFAAKEEVKGLIPHPSYDHTLWCSALIKR